MGQVPYSRCLLGNKEHSIKSVVDYEGDSSQIGNFGHNGSQLATVLGIVGTMRAEIFELRNDRIFLFLKFLHIYSMLRMTPITFP